MLMGLIVSYVVAIEPGVRVHLHGTGYGRGSVAKVFSRFPRTGRYNIPIFLRPRRYHE